MSLSRDLSRVQLMRDEPAGRDWSGLVGTQSDRQPFPDVRPPVKLWQVALAFTLAALLWTAPILIVLYNTRPH